MGAQLLLVELHLLLEGGQLVDHQLLGVLQLLDHLSVLALLLVQGELEVLALGLENLCELLLLKAELLGLALQKLDLLDKLALLRSQLTKQRTIILLEAIRNLLIKSRSTRTPHTRHRR